ncbi:MAG: MFS transporter [Streptosporangiales bacterium]|nr:MFS transporter [Streptosporangiales bacterium]
MVGSPLARRAVLEFTSRKVLRPASPCQPRDTIGRSPVAGAQATPPASDAGDPREAKDVRRAWRTLSVVSLASVLTALGGSALNVALPEVVRHFDASPVAASWMLLGFMLTNTVLAVVFGRFADMFGRRGMYLCGLTVYLLASLVLGLAPNEWVVVGLRVVQAAGAAMLITNSAALITEAFPRSRLGQGMGIYTASFSAAQLIGPTLGGFLTHEFGWQWVFWYNVPLGLVCLLWGYVALPRSRPSGGTRGIDVPGNIGVLIGLGSLLLGLSQVGQQGWTHPLVLGGVALFLVFLPFFIWIELRSPYPVVDVRLFRDAPLALNLVAGFLNSVARVAAVLLMALYFQAAHGETTFEAGMKVLPLPIATIIASTSSGFWQRWLRPRTLVVMGSATTTVGLLVLLAAVSPANGYLPVAFGLVLIGLGSGTFLPSNTTALLHGIPDDRIGIANALRLMMQSTGVMVGTALALSLVAGPLPADLRPHVFAGTLSGISGPAVDALITGYHWALSCMAGISALALLTSFGGRRADTRVAAPPGRTTDPNPASLQ